MTHDYKRHGTTTLFAALDVLEGLVIGRAWVASASGIHLHSSTRSIARPQPAESRT